MEAMAPLCSVRGGLGWQPGDLSAGSSSSAPAVHLGRVLNLSDLQCPHAENESSRPLDVWDSLMQKF